MRRDKSATLSSCGSQMPLALIGANRLASASAAAAQSSQRWRRARASSGAAFGGKGSAIGARRGSPTCQTSHQPCGLAPSAFSYERGFSMRFGTDAMLGRSNVGKSTFLNAALGEPLAIVSPLPQTTRDTLLGIARHGEAEIAFWDTPGL